MAIKTGYFSGTQTTGGTDINVNPGEPLDLGGSQDYDATYYDWAGGNPERITIQTAGDYLVVINIPTDYVNVPNAERQNQTIRVRVNGTAENVGKGQSGYLKNDADHGDSSICLYTYLDNLQVNDYVDFLIVGEAFDGTTNVDGQFWAYIEEVSEETKFFATTDTHSGGTTALDDIAEVTLDWDEVHKDTGFTHTAASGTITLDDPADYMILVNIPIETDDADDVRQNWIGRIKLQGNEVNGGRMAQGYIRNFDAHNQSSLHWCGVITTVGTNEALTVTIDSEIDASVSNATIPGSLASIYVQKLSAGTSVFKGRGTQLEGAQNDWNGATNSVEWVNTPIKDANVYTHDTGTNPHLITLEDTGNYLALFNVSLTSTNTRPHPDAQGKYNGANLDGVRSAHSYIRNVGDHFNSSLSFMAPLHNITGGNDFEVEIVAEGAAGVDDSNEAMLVLIKKDVVSDVTDDAGVDTHSASVLQGDEYEPDHLHWDNTEDWDNAQSETNVEHTTDEVHLSGSNLSGSLTTGKKTMRS